MPHVCYDRAVQLAMEGHEVHVVTTCWSKIAGVLLPHEYEFARDVHVHYTNSPAHQWSRDFAIQCRVMYDELKPDILHSDSFDRDNVWWGGLPMHITMHGFTLGAWLTEWNVRRAFNHAMSKFPEEEILREIDNLSLAKTVLAVSKWEHRMLTDQYGLNTRLVYNPIGHHFFEPRTETTRKVFICVAISQAGKRGFRFARQAAIKANVQLVTAASMSRDTIPALYDYAKAVVLPTTFAQGYDLAIAEGRARCCPAIMSGTGSYLDEAMWWDKLVPIGDVDAIRQAMEEPFFRVPEPGPDFPHRPNIHVENWLAALV